MSIADRLKQARTERPDLSQERLADLAGVAQSTIGNIESGTRRNPRELLAIAAALGVNPQWLKSGKGPKQAASNVSPIAPHRSVPLVSWVQAGAMGDVTDQFQPGEADEWIDAYATLPGEQSFALRVDGDSMTSPYAGDKTTFPEGTIIIVDPARATHAGDLVVAKDVATQKATFKKLTTDGGRWYLKPLNPSYPTVEIDDPALRVIGRVIEALYRQKL